MPGWLVREIKMIEAVRPAKYPYPQLPGCLEYAVDELPASHRHDRPGYSPGIFQRSRIGCVSIDNRYRPTVTICFALSTLLAGRSVLIPEITVAHGRKTLIRGPYGCCYNRRGGSRWHHRRGHNRHYNNRHGHNCLRRCRDGGSPNRDAQGRPGRGYAVEHRPGSGQIVEVVPFRALLAALLRANHSRAAPGNLPFSSLVRGKCRRQPIAERGRLRSIIFPGNPEVFLHLGFLQIFHPLDDGIANRLPVHRRRDAELTLDRRYRRYRQPPDRSALSSGWHGCRLSLRDRGHRPVDWRRGSTPERDLRGLQRRLWHPCHKL